MAKLMLTGDTADVELTHDEDEIVATCTLHAGSRDGCGWTQRYDDLRDATEYAADHADCGTA